MFDYAQFFSQHGVEYVTRGANVARGHIAIRCPWCGRDDPSQHLGVSTEGKGWGCLRNSDHRGKSPIKLIQAVLGCDYERAKTIVGGSVFIPENFMDRVLQQLRPPAPAAERKLKLLPEFKELNTKPSCKLFNAYLAKRGYSTDQIATFSKRFGIRYCTSGPFKGRIIFPVVYQGKLVSWTGRTVYPSETFRYKALTPDAEQAKLGGVPPAVGPVSHYLLWFDKLMTTQARTIYLTEGPFDALRMMVLGKDHGICSTCFFTAEPTGPQIDLLHELLPRFDTRYLLLDQGTTPTMLKVAAKLTGLNVTIKQLPPSVKDPGALSINQFNELACV